MNAATIFLVLMLTAACGHNASSTSQAAAAGDATPASADAAALGTALHGKQLACWKRGGDKAAVLFAASVNAGAIAVSGGFDGTEALSQMLEVKTGDTLMLQASGPDADEGQVVLLVGSYYLSGDGAEGPTDAEAIVYGEIGPGDGSGALVKLSCELR